MEKPQVSCIEDKIDNRSNICIILPTFNQYHETKKNIDLLKKQTVVPDIIIVDNNSNDGTFDKFNQEYRDIILIKSAGNYGGSGGFYLGQKYAYRKGYEWIILNDNDAYPIDNNLIENLIKNSNKYTSAQPLNIAEQSNIYNSHYIYTFHYNIYHKSLIKKIGFVDYKLFIYGDEVEYINRTLKNKLKYKKISSRYTHPLKNFLPSKLTYFSTRNKIYNNIKYKTFKTLFIENIFIFMKLLIYKHLWNLDTYYNNSKMGLSDVINNNFNRNEQIINQILNDNIVFYKDSIDNFIEKYKFNKKVLFSLKDIFNGNSISKELSIKNIQIPRKEILYKNTIITNGFKDNYRIFLSFFFKKVIFIKDIDWSRGGGVDFFIFKNIFIKKILILILLILLIPYILYISILLKIKYGREM